MDLLLRSIASCYRSNVKYHKYHLALLLPHLKELLLVYIAHASPSGLTMTGFQALFPSYAGQGEVERLIIATSQANEAHVTKLCLSSSNLNESIWKEELREEEQGDFTDLNAYPLGRFPNLTHLSLVNSTYPLDDILQSAPKTLTHLSLAYTTSTDLVILSKSLLSLLVLDLSGCNWVMEQWSSIGFTREWRTIEQVILVNVDYFSGPGGEQRRQVEQRRINVARGSSRITSIVLTCDMV
jgi:hypothetical protein